MASLVMLGVSPDETPRKSARAPALHTFDLTYTVHLDRSDPVQLRRIWDHTHFVASLQGIVNRNAPHLYVFLVGEPNGRFDRFWLEEMRRPGGWLSKHDLRPVKDIPELVRTFRSRIKGLVVYDEKVPATSNVASTAAGVEDLVCVRYDPSPGSLYRWLAVDPSGPRLPVKLWLINRDGSSMFTGRGTIPGTAEASSGSAKCDAYLWAKRRYLDTGRCNPRRLGYYLDAWWLRNPDGYVPNHMLSNHDYFIAQRGFIFDLSPWNDETPVDDREQPVGTDEKTLRAILRSAYDQANAGVIHVGGFVPWGWKYTNYGKAGGTREGVPAEWRYAEILSCFNAYMDADAIGLCGMANASVFSRHPLQRRYAQTKPTLDDLKRRGLVDSSGSVASKNYVAIYGGDYDSAAWLYWRLPDIWPDPARGTIPVGWAFNPNLAERFAAGMDYARRHAKPGDVFIAVDNGAGYLNPSYLVPPRPWSGLPSGLRAWEEHCSRFYRQWDLSLTGFIIDGNARPTGGEVLDAYARFSPDGVVGQKTPREAMHGSMPVMRMEYDLYEADAGARVILSRARPEVPRFFMYRTILWSPTKLKELMDAVKADPRGRDIEFVDPHTTMLLLKQHLTGPDQGRKRSLPVEMPAPGVRTNLWDVRYGAKVRAHSELVSGCDIRDIFGGVYGSIEGGGAVLFADGKPDGYVHYVEWSAPDVMRLERFEVYARGDGGSDNREFAEMRLYRRDGSGWALIQRFSPQHPYRYEDAGPGRLWSVELDQPVVAREFRAEFAQRGSRSATPMGPRVLQLVGVGTLAPADR
ncbi:MAG: hypothetical protein GX446_07100 [Chthonomonadales bacterium]|nr:hypothetical protein [Chthonomonadales bacterium]